MDHDQGVRGADAVTSTKLPTLCLRHDLYGDGRAAWLVVVDPCAGRKHVYTVYRISLTGDKEAHVIGRELPLALARDVVKHDRKSLA